jgi:hypothetical protein
MRLAASLFIGAASPHCFCAPSSRSLRPPRRVVRRSTFDQRLDGEGGYVWAGRFQRHRHTAARRRGRPVHRNVLSRSTARLAAGTITRPHRRLNASFLRNCSGTCAIGRIVSPVRGHAEFRQKIHLALVSKFPGPALRKTSLPRRQRWSPKQHPKCGRRVAVRVKKSKLNHRFPGTIDLTTGSCFSAPSR